MSYWMKSIDHSMVAFLEPQGNNRFTLGGTGFFAAIYGTNYLVTAKHVIVKTESGIWTHPDTTVAWRARDGEVHKTTLGEIEAFAGVQWQNHARPEVDVIMSALPSQFQTEVQALPVDASLCQRDISELDELVYCVYPPRLMVPNGLSPVIRSGIVAALNTEEAFVMDGLTFPGNSGSPVMFAPVDERSQTYAKSGPVDTAFPKLAGLVSNAITNEVVAGEAKSRLSMAFHENTGLTGVTSIKAILETAENGSIAERS